MSKPNILKSLMVAAGVLLILSLIMAAVAISKPVRLNQKTALVSYAQNGQFNYIVYLRPSDLYGSASAAPAIVSEFPQKVVGKIAFAYTFQPAAADVSGTARVEAALENPGIWQKTLLLAPDTAVSGSFTLNFSLDMSQVSQIFTAIETETDISATTEDVVINAYFQSGANITVQSLPITIANNLISIPDALSSSQDAGTGQFTYNINPVIPEIQTTDTVYPSFNLTGEQPLPTITTPIILQPGQTDFVNLVDKMDAGFAYQFQADKPVQNLQISVDITANLTAAQSWSKSFDLLQTTEDGNFNLDFPIDIAGYNALIQAINSETGAAPTSYSLTVTANIHVTGDTAYGPIDDTFAPALAGTITGNVLDWSQNLSTGKTGAITRTTLIDNKFIGLAVPAAIIIFSLLGLVFLVLLIILAVTWNKHHESGFSIFNREIQQIHKNYGARIAESSDDAPTADKNPVGMNSIGDLMKIADELGKPVVHQSTGPSADFHLYYVIDGNTRYQYSVFKDKSK